MLDEIICKGSMLLMFVLAFVRIRHDHKPLKKLGRQHSMNAAGADLGSMKGV